MTGTSTQDLVSEDKFNTKPRRVFQYVASLSATLGAFALGTVLAWTSPAGATIQKEGYNGFSVDKEQNSWLGGLMALGAAAALFPVGWLVDKVGRKITMLGLVVPFTIGWVLMIWAQNIGMMYAGRFITGMSGGSFSLCAPVYISEIAEPSIRGTLGTYFQLLITIGILFTYGIGSGVSVFVLSIICAIVPIIFGVIFFFMPESPLFLVKKGKIDAARDSLKFFRGNDFNVEPELQDMKLSAEREAQEKLSYAQAFQSRAAKQGLFVSLGLMLFQQLSGVNAIVFNTETIFKDAGSSLDPSICTIIIGAVQVITTFISSMVVDRLGRKILLLISIGVMAICMVLLGMYFYFSEYDPDTANSMNWLPLLCLCVYIVVFSLGFGPIPWMMVGELFPSQIKGPASSVACMSNWLLAFIVTKFFENLNSAVGQHSTFWIFGGICVVGIFFVLIVVPETKGKSLEEIQVVLGGEERSMNRS